MRETLKRLARFSAAYSLSALIGPLFTVLLTPLYTRVLEPADYGVVDVLMTLSALLVALASAGMDQALSAHFFDRPEAEGGDGWRRNLSTTALIIVGGLALVAALLVAAFAEPLAQALFHDPARRVTVLLLAVNVASLPLYNLTIVALRLRMRVAQANLVSLVYLFGLIGAAIVLVLGLRLRATGIIAANAIASTLATAIGLAVGARGLRGQPSVSLGRALLAVGVGALPASIGLLVFNNIDRLLLTQFVSPTDLGLYSIANKLSSMSYVVMSPVLAAWWPMALEMVNRPDAPRQFARFFEYFLVAGCLLALGIGLGAPEILTWFTRDAYVPAAPYALALLAYNGPVGFAFAFLQVALVARKRTGLISLAFLISAASNIVLNLILMPRIGVWAAVIATVVAGIIHTGILYRFAQRVYPVRYRWLRILVLLGGFAAIVLAFVAQPLPWPFWTRLLALALMVVLIFAVGVVTPAQVLDIARAALRRLGRRPAPSSGTGRETLAPVKGQEDSPS